jgi:2-desacetyl-2-hydroxyethyl bacteriochlorophyllide A dehydrogenase
MSRRSALYFLEPRRTEIREETLPEPGPGQVELETITSAISPGSELLVFTGSAPQNMSADRSITSLQGDLSFPLKYGYSSVGRISRLGPDVDAAWLGQRVFSFQPHQTASIADLEHVLPVPSGLDAAHAALYPLVETAVTLVWDAAPLLGEDTAIVGQGPVGLAAAALLSEFPLGCLYSLETIPGRRALSRAMGTRACLHPDEAESLHPRGRGFDLVLELSGDPRGLDRAINLCGFAGRIVVGSWYGSKMANLDLGGRFHRERLRLISSQVSTLPPEIASRMDRNRRTELTWWYLTRLDPELLITCRLPFSRAAEAYQALDEDREKHILAVLDYNQ